MTLLTSCPTCGLNYVDPDDNKAHNKHHQQYLDACSFLDYTPMRADQREQHKARGYQLLKDEHAALDGALLVLRAHYDRSLEHAIVQGYWHQHPAFETYVRMLRIEEHYPLAVVKQLRAQYGGWLPGIDPGSSYWEPK